MPIGPLHLLLLLAAAFAAGAINSVAGGGTLLTFPALLAVLGPNPAGPILANGTSTVALVPGSLSAFWGFRGELGGGPRRGLWEMAAPSLLGGALGAYLATHINAAVFGRLVPWLIFGATFLFLIQDSVRRWVGRKEAPPAPNPGGARPLGPGGMLFQLFVAVYGGFFGAGIGILMLAALGFLGQTNIHRMNGLKNFAAVCINGVGALTFIVYRRVDWELAGLMAVAAVAGGWGGAGLARRVGQANVRRLVVAIGLLFGAYTLYGQIRHAH
jgi:uncharacterized membrane protein YfcA